MTAARPSRVAQQGQGRSACPNPLPGAATRLCHDPRARAGITAASSPARTFQPAADLGQLALQGGELDAPITERRKASRLVGRSGRGLQLPARLTTGPCSIPGVSRGPAAAPRRPSQGRVGARLDNRAPAQAIVTRRAETGPLNRLLRPRAGWLGTRQAAREKAQRRGRGPGWGAGRCSRPKPRARSRPKDGMRQTSDRTANTSYAIRFLKIVKIR